MRRIQTKTSSAMGLALLLTLGAGVACERGPEDETAEVDREMDMALEGDTAAEPELRDEPQEETAEQPQARQPETQEPRRQAPATQPREQQPRAEAPREERQPESPTTITLSAAEGSTLRIILNQELSTRNNQAGDLFTARVADAVSDGRNVVIPQGATVRGQVTAVQESGRQGEQAIIKLEFSEISMDGATYPLRATIVQANPETRSRTGTGGRVARIGGGAAAGAILGRVIGGDTKGAVIGAAVGAAAGTAITLGTEDVDAVLPEGSEMTIRLDEPVVVQRQAS